MPDSARANKNNAPSLQLALLFVILAAGILVAGYLFYSNYEKTYITQVENQLSSITNLKIDDLVQYRLERSADAATLSQNDSLTLLVHRFFANPSDNVAKEELRAWLGKYQSNNQYDSILLLDTQGNVRIAVPELTAPVSSTITQGAAQTLQSGRVYFQDFYRSEYDHKVYLALLVPVLDAQDNAPGPGVLALRIDPDTHLYPLISRWPTPASTAETLLVRRDGNDALFLNDLKYQNDAALKLRIPLEQADVPAVKAILGQTGIVKGTDYRGQEVIADVRPVPGSPWFMVARIDRSEVYTPLTQVLWSVVAFLGALLIVAASGVGLLYWRQAARTYAEKAAIGESLRMSEEKFRNIFDKSSVGISITSFDGSVNSNQAFADMLGYTKEELSHVKWQDITYTEDIVESDKHLELLWSGSKDSVRFINRYVKKDGSIVWADVNTVLQRDRDGMPLYYITGIVDITEQKQAEEIILQKTLELERSNAELQRFAYVASHDLQEPLRTISSYMQLLEKRYKPHLDENAGKYINAAVQGANRLQQMISGLLDYSRVETQSNPFEMVNCEKVFLQVVSGLQKIIDENKAVVTHDPLPVVFGDRHQLLRLFQNLIANSLRYRGSEPPCIHVSCEVKNGENVFSIRDNGIGIEPQYRERIFVIFQRLHGRDVPGIGLGLSIAHKIVERHGGSIWVESEPGKGATFYFTIPVKGGV
jgi:PAS domain S-box-containing protein